MNSTTRNRIRTAVMNDLKQRHTNVPEHAIPIFKPAENSANALTQTVIKFLQAEGHQAERISTSGRYIEDRNSQGHKTGRGKWIPGSGTRGSSDISCIINKPQLEYGIPLKIEIKYGKDRQSNEQKDYQAAIEKTKGLYWIIRNLDNFIEKYDELLK